MMMRMLLVTCIMGLAMLNRECNGLSCHECLNIELTSSASSLRDLLAASSTIDPSCKEEGEHVNIKKVRCAWENGILDGSDLSDLPDRNGTIADYYEDSDSDTVVCQIERTQLTVYVSGETITAGIWSRGCKAVPSSTPLSCTDDVEDHEHALIAYLADELDGSLGYGTRTSVSGNICFCNTDNCNTASPLTTPAPSPTTRAPPPCTRNCNSASLLTAPAWITALPLLAIAAAFLSRG